MVLRISFHPGSVWSLDPSLDTAQKWNDDFKHVFWPLFLGTDLLPPDVPGFQKT